MPVQFTKMKGNDRRANVLRLLDRDSALKSVFYMITYEVLYHCCVGFLPFIEERDNLRE